MSTGARWAVVAILALVPLAAAGCGGGGDDDATPASTAASTPTVASTTLSVEARTATAPGGVAGSSGSLTITGGVHAGTYDVGFCFADGSTLSLSASGNDQNVDVNAMEGSGSLLVANTANTELTNGTVETLTADGDGAFTGSGAYSDGTAFTLSGTCES